MSTGSDANDGLLRVASDHSELIDFVQPASELTLALGAGNDTLNVDQPFLPTVDGQDGTNRINVIGGNRSFDLTSFSPNLLRRIDVLDISGSDRNQLKLEVSVVANLSNPGNRLEVIANPGDAVLIGDGWQLSGTQVVDGRFYRLLEQTLPGTGTVELFLSGPNDWQNPVNRHDVNNDGVSTDPTGDILALINEVNNPKLMNPTNGRLPDAATVDAALFRYFDVNGDGFLTPAGDILLQINEANRQGDIDGESSRGAWADREFENAPPRTWQQSIVPSAMAIVSIDPKLDDSFREERRSGLKLRGEVLPASRPTRIRERVFALTSHDELQATHAELTEILSELTNGPEPQ